MIVCWLCELFSGHESQSVLKMEGGKRPVQQLSVAVHVDPVAEWIDGSMQTQISGERGG